MFAKHAILNAQRLSSLGDVLKSPAALKNNTALLVDEFQCA